MLMSGVNGRPGFFGHQQDIVWASKCAFSMKVQVCEIGKKVCTCLKEAVTPGSLVSHILCRITEPIIVKYFPLMTRTFPRLHDLHWFNRSAECRNVLFIFSSPAAAAAIGPSASCWDLMAHNYKLNGMMAERLLQSALQPLN